MSYVVGWHTREHTHTFLFLVVCFKSVVFRPFCDVFLHPVLFYIFIPLITFLRLCSIRVRAIFNISVIYVLMLILLLVLRIELLLHWLVSRDTVKRWPKLWIFHSPDIPLNVNIFSWHLLWINFRQCYIRLRSSSRIRPGEGLIKRIKH